MERVQVIIIEFQNPSRKNQSWKIYGKLSASGNLSPCKKSNTKRHQKRNLSKSQRQ